MPNLFVDHSFEAEKSSKLPRVRAYKPVIPPALLLHEIPQTLRSKATVTQARREIQELLHGRDPLRRLLVIVGPCSIHDPDAALDYCRWLLSMRERFGDELVIVMRAYLEKPRTTVGWKGLINDPYLDGTHNINEGLQISRHLFLALTELGMPIASEMLDTLSPPYLSDLLSCGAVGARTTESQLHREMASGLDFPVGFKNGTDGSLDTAVDAMRASEKGHRFLSPAQTGVLAVAETEGNPDCFLILRGGRMGSNYGPEAIKDAKTKLKTTGFGGARVMVDCSHGNSNKNYKNQPVVAGAVADQVGRGEDSLFGVMIESNINEGNQRVGLLSDLKYGVSITDACIGREDTELVFATLAAAVRKRRAKLPGA